MKRMTQRHATLSIPCLRLEGGLFLPDQLEKAALGQAALQTEADYRTPKGLRLKDEYSRAFQVACAQWRHFAARTERKDLNPATESLQFVRELLRDAFGYAAVLPCEGIAVGDRHYPAKLCAGTTLPVVVAPHTLGLDEPHADFAVTGSGSKRKSAFQLAQELLNASPDHLWALVCNGRQLRLLRDASTLTRPSFLEVDLEDLLEGNRFAEFAMVWRLLHASRAGLEPGSACVWERWREAGQAEGTRVREGLREGVTQALLTLGDGFLQHPSNEPLRRALQEGVLGKDAFFQQLLRLVYRLIFLFSVEERGLLHPEDNSPDALQARRAYAGGYAASRLRDLCLRRRARNRFDDLWQAMRIVFRGLAGGEARLALPALGGLFAEGQCEALDAASLGNTPFLEAIRNLRWANHKGSLAPVDYRNMGPEELGSVYESLLELVPDIDLPARRFGFVGLTDEGSTAGNARKLSGSYYTPDALVQELIRSALDPVIDSRIAAQPTDPAAAVLGIRVIDPACGSGHFLLAAARRLAERVAQLRAPEGAVKPQDYRHALREVIGRCIFGVDRNPMALELARTALWLESFEEGRPLGFLDHHLQCGDALLGLQDLDAVKKGIPKDAFKPLSGDDKTSCKTLAKANATGLKQLERDLQSGQLLMQFADGTGDALLSALEALPAETTEDIARKESAYAAYRQQAVDSRLSHAADLVLGAFLLPKTEATAASVPTSATLYLSLTGAAHGPAHAAQLAAARAACREARVLHWPLAFPQVFAAGGFDCVLGNPPWERIKLQEEEFFATRHRDVAEARNKAERAQRIQWLSEGMLARHLFPEQEHAPRECTAEQRLYDEFLSARRVAEATSVFAHVSGEDGGRYPLTGVGDVNTYALFAEMMSGITADSGRAGFIVPTGIATDDSTKAFFGALTQGGRLVSLYDLENRDAIFPSVHRSYKFCLMTLGKAAQAEFVCFATQTSQLTDARRRFRLSPEEFRLINPNTLTCPVFRSERDAELTKKIYRNNVILRISDSSSQGSGWNVSLRTMFHKSMDSHLFVDSSKVSDDDGYLPLFEGSLGHQFNFRYGEFNGERELVVDDERLSDPFFFPRTEWAISESAFAAKCESMRLDELAVCRTAFLGFRRVSRSTDERTVIACIIPWMPMTYGWILTLKVDARKMAALCGNYNSLVFDYLLRTSLSQPSIPQGAFEQVALPPPERFDRAAMEWLLPRILELSYTAHALTAWARDLGYNGQPFAFDPDRRALLRAELDAFYARLYGLTRDELRYILDPADVMGEDYPSETFRVLKNNELRAFGEYRTRRLVLEAWDALQQEATREC
jgi:hypothetical protein